MTIASGFVVIEQFFRSEELEPCRQACWDLTDKVAHKLYSAGKIPSLYEEHGVFQRLNEIERAFPGAAILLFKQGILPQAFMDLWCNDKLLNVAEQIVGPDVAGHPVWNLRIKPSQNNYTTVPWHQGTHPEELEGVSKSPPYFAPAC